MQKNFFQSHTHKTMQVPCTWLVILVRNYLSLQRAIGACVWAHVWWKGERSEINDFNQGLFYLPGNIWQCLEEHLVVTAWRYYWSPVVRGQDAAQHPAMHRTGPTTGNLTAWDVSSAKIEKTWEKEEKLSNYFSAFFPPTQSKPSHRTIASQEQEDILVIMQFRVL